MGSPNLELFLQKNRLLNKMISKNQVNRRKFSLEKKMHCFLKVLTTFYKEISEIINSIGMKERQKGSMRINKYNIFTKKV